MFLFLIISKITYRLCISRETSLAASCGKWHTIVEGEDCDKIRKEHNLSQEEFNEMNKYLDCKQLTVRKKLFSQKNFLARQ